MKSNDAEPSAKPCGSNWMLPRPTGKSPAMVANVAASGSSTGWRLSVVVLTVCFAIVWFLLGTRSVGDARRR